MDEQMRRIDLFLREHERSLETISEEEIITLKTVDDEIQKRLRENDAARRVIKSNKITVLSVCRAAKIPRSTAYYKSKRGSHNDSNAALVPLYIENYVRKNEDVISLEAKYESLLLENKTMKKELKRIDEKVIPAAEYEARLIDKDRKIHELEIELTNAKRLLAEREGRPNPSHLSS